MQVTVYQARWVLPVATPPIRDGTVLVDEQGRIAAVAPSAALDVPESVAVEDLGDAVILPGLINVHAHPELAMFRGALEDLPFRDWILRLVGAKRTALGNADYDAASRWTLIEAMAAGITTLAATETSGAAFGALREAGLRGLVYLEVFGPDPTDADSSLRTLRAEVERLRALETDLVQVGVSPHAPYTVSDPLFAGAALYARAESLPLAVHASESAAESALVREGGGDFAPGLRARGIATPRRGRSTVELLDRLGVLDARPLLIHCVDVDGDDIGRIADAGAAVAHCPVANAKLGHGMAPLLDLKQAGVRVGIGSDSVASNNRIDLFEEARIAALLQRAQNRSSEILPPAELLYLCTLGGASVLGLADRVGSLEPGKDADLCVVSLAGSHVAPVHEPTTALFHSARATDVLLTAVRGRVLYRAGVFQTLDAPAVGAAVERSAAKLREALGPVSG